MADVREGGRREGTHPGEPAGIERRMTRPPLPLTLRVLRRASRLASRLAPRLALAAFLVAPASAAPPPEAPRLTGDAWLNAAPLRLEELRGKVVLVEFWTFACWNCKNVEPYVKDWHARYADQGLVVIAVHTPEFEREKKLENVRRYVAEQGITYPVLVDSGFTTWRRYGNRYWPALYLVDKQGRIRHQRIGEGGYASTESWIQRLLAEEPGGG